uniref:Uncharacterized protein n=1 Tax=Magnusiomyces tetraspermus TaxID=1232584 RepID=A0A023UMW0_9ASCO|nr:hypothetical protein [Magnusiomyces tetraspermus]AHY04945.1 hypothetical protein [Magnusiomyces tetraspermus]
MVATCPRFRPSRGDVPTETAHQTPRDTGSWPPRTTANGGSLQDLKHTNRRTKPRFCMVVRSARGSGTLGEAITPPPNPPHRGGNVKRTPEGWTHQPTKDFVTMDTQGKRIWPRKPSPRKSSRGKGQWRA